jgi:two-component sensor histidine kinase
MMQRKNERFVERLPLVLKRPWHAYLMVTAFCAIALLLREVAGPLLPKGYPFLSFFPAVILSSFLFGVRPGIYAAILCGGLAWYFFIDPVWTFFVGPGVAVAMGFYTGVVVVDIALIHWMQRANYQLAVERERSRALAENRELLFHELQHRVSNNLQVVAALLTLQRRQVDHEAAAQALDDAAARLALIGKISRGLYDPTGEGQSIKAFLDMLTGELLEASGRQDIEIIVTAPEDMALDPAIVVPLSLIAAEAVSNAIEHGLTTRTGGVITIRLDQSTKENVALRICDNGAGLPSGFDMGSRTSLGLRIATMLAKQLGGHFRLERLAQGGTMAALDIPPQHV